ncbi:hypothetical protein RPC_1612 [Rhodopseudomonas palustris BisB18]|uniref:Uncharacterized protein n=1 Tax=Rhodopseudomonas palustris (strain BisB18) TaxID=316056 RepID=Q218L2_RHOPB
MSRTRRGACAAPRAGTVTDAALGCGRGHAPLGTAPARSATLPRCAASGARVAGSPGERSDTRDRRTHPHIAPLMRATCYLLAPRPGRGAAPAPRREPGPLRMLHLDAAHEMLRLERRLAPQR